MARRGEPAEQVGRCRWRVRNRWRYGHLARPQVLERDGSLRVYDDLSGGARSIPAVMVEHEEPGGGRRTRWVPSAAAPVVIGPTDRAHKPAQLGLFDN